MAWIQSHQEIERHPKTLKLSLLMQWDIDQTIGKLHRFWWWCLDYAPDGNVSRHSADMVALCVGLSADMGEKFLSALYETGFLDKTKKNCLVIHDWLEHAGKYLRDTKYRHTPKKIQEIKDLYSTVVSRQSADNQPTIKRGSAVDKIRLDKIDKTIKTFSSDSDEIRLSELLLSFIKQRNPNHKQPNIQSWAKKIDLMICDDNRPRTDIEKVIRWCQKDNFWQNNILSTETLRKNYDKLFLKMHSKGGQSGKFTGLDEKDYHAGTW